MRVLDALGQACRSRRVHQREQIARLDVCRRRIVARFRVQEAERAIARGFVVRRRVDQHPRRREGNALPYVIEHRELVGRGEHDLRRCIGEQRREARRGEQRRQGNRGRAELRARPVGREQLQRIDEHGGDPIAARDSERSKRIRPAVDVGVELAPRESNLPLALSARRDDDGRAMRTVARVPRKQGPEHETVGGDGCIHEESPNTGDADGRRARNPASRCGRTSQARAP